MIKSPLNVIVGEWYDVPCIGDYPILGPAHVDGTDLCQNVPTLPHFHIDRRFTTFLYEPKFGLVDESQELSYQRLQCVQERSDNGQVLWAMIRLARAYQHHQIDVMNPVCPHKKQNIVNADGMCSGHGLCWNMETGRLKYKLPYYLQYKGYEKKFPAFDRETHYLPYTRDEPHNGPVIVELIDALGQVIGEYAFGTMSISRSDILKITTECVSS